MPAERARAGAGIGRRRRYDQPHRRRRRTVLALFDGRGDGALATIDGCTAAPRTYWVSPNVYEQRYDGCRNGASVAARVTVGGGHNFAVADNEAMWTFLSRHARR